MRMTETDGGDSMTEEKRDKGLTHSNKLISAIDVVVTNMLFDQHNCSSNNERNEKYLKKQQ